MKLRLHVADLVLFLLTVRGSSSSAPQVHASSGLVETRGPPKSASGCGLRVCKAGNEDEQKV